MRNTFKEPDLQALFAEQGYVVVPLLSAEEAARHRKAALQCMPTDAKINDPQGALYNTTFGAEESRDAGNALADRVVRPMLEALFDDYRYEGGSVMAKLPGSDMLAMHQHQPLSSDIFEPSLHCWLTLDDVGAENGALRVIPGSHQILRHIQSFNSPPFFSSFAGALEERYAVTVPMRAGEAVLFERSLLHGSCPNRTARPTIRILSTLLPIESALCILAERGTDVFEALEVGDQSIDPGLYCIAGGDTSRLKSAGLLPNRNMPITEREFARLLRLGAKVRPGYDPVDEIRRPQHRQFMSATLGRLWDAVSARMRN